MRPGLAHGEDTTYRIIGLAVRVHTNLGPGLLESAYHKCLAHELTRTGVPCEQNISLPLVYDGLTVDPGYIADMIVANEVIVEIKAVDQLTRLHQA